MASAVVYKQRADAPRGRKPRPNYNQIHQNLLPIEVYPLPTLIPHNPLSLIAIAFSYVAQIIAPPQRQTYNAYFSSATSSIHVTDPAAIRAMWQMGFFGRGSLSRSEPNWMATRTKKGSTAEENTRARRNERRQAKLERAKKEQEDITSQLLKEKSLSLDSDSHDVDNTDGNLTPTSANELAGELPTTISGLGAVEANGLPTPPSTSASSDVDLAEDRPKKRLQRGKSVRFSPTIEAREFDLSSPTIVPIKAPGISTSSESEKQPLTPAEDKEHLNLSLEEAFFLSYGLGVLKINCEDTDTLLPPTSLLPLFRQHSYFPTRSLSMPAEPDDPFMLSYAVYHHYRSLGWVVRSGVKFSVDFLLYNRGPAFSHAEFAVVIIPSYTSRYWGQTAERRKDVAEKTRKSWWWLHNVNRVQAQVHKQLILCYVDVPPPIDRAVESANVSSDPNINIDVGKELARYKVRDVGIRRWTPNRSRD